MDGLWWMFFKGDIESSYIKIIKWGWKEEK